MNKIGEEYHPYKLPLNDNATFNTFASGDLGNIFQFNASSLKQILHEFKPNSIHDLSIINAMFRPRLLEYITTIIRHKLDAKNDLFQSDIRVSEILRETYGFLIYQESFLHLSKEIAGIDFIEAEEWRRKILRDKTKTEITKFSSAFSNGCDKNSTLNDIEKANLISLITEMVYNVFPKAHSLSYSIIGYWGAFYKTYFRDYFDKAFSKDIEFPIS